MYYVYILASSKKGTLYIGVTNDLIRRVSEHKKRVNKCFTSRYGVDKLVYYEAFESAYNAIHREKCIKKWKRIWKFNLIYTLNKDWKDLYFDFLE